MKYTLRPAYAVVAVAIVLQAACGVPSSQTQLTPTIVHVPNPPFPELERLDADVELVVIGEVVQRSPVEFTDSPDNKTHFCSYNAVVNVERTLLGPDTTTVRMNLYIRSAVTSDGPGVPPTRLLAKSDSVMAFLSKDSTLFDLEEGEFLSEAIFWVQGPDVVKYSAPITMGLGAVECSAHHSLANRKETQPLEEVIEWVDEFSRLNPPR